MEVVVEAVEAVGSRHLQLAEETLRHPLLLDGLLLRRRQLLRLHFLHRLRVPAEKGRGKERGEVREEEA